MQHFEQNTGPNQVNRLVGQKRSSRSPSIDPGVARKDSKARDEQNVRSHSSEIQVDINKNMEALNVRLQNQSKIQTGDNPVTLESGAASNRQNSRASRQSRQSRQSRNSNRNSSRSSRRSKSMSSDGSLNKRKIKSNQALLNKQYQIIKGNDMDNDDDEGGKGSKKQMIVAIDDDTASEIFNKLTKIQGKKSYYAKKNWTDDEAKLLQWAILKYCKGKGITPQKLDKNNWIEIAHFIPGRNDSQCQYKFNQDKKSTIQKCNWVKREDEELVRLIRSHGTKQWSQIATQLNESLNVSRNGKQCRERWVNFLNPEIKKDPFSLQEDILILEKRLSIGNKWSEIIKEMPGRTENNVKNRFNMMFKNIKDEYIKNRTHQSVFVMQEKVDQDNVQAEDQIDEEKLIRKLIEKKQKELEEKQKNNPQTTARNNNDLSGDISMNTGNQQTTQNNVQEVSDSASNINMNESSRRSFTNPTSIYNGNQSALEQSISIAQTADWVKQKEFLKMSNICQNKEQINHAIERLIVNCPGQLNIIKRLVEYIQEDINRMIRIQNAYASNTSLGSTNNLIGTPGNNNTRMLDQRTNSPNQNTFDHVSNHSISPSGEPRSTGLSGQRGHYPNKQIIMGGGPNGENQLQVVQTQRPDNQQPNTQVYNSLNDTMNEPFPKTPEGLNLNKSPMASNPTLRKLPNGQYLRVIGVSPQQNGRTLTPNQRMNGPNNNYHSLSKESQFTRYRSMSPMGSGSELPCEKQFIETTTGETLVISNIGVFASRKGEDRFVPLQYPEQILFAPFVQLQQRKNSSTVGTFNYKTGQSGIQESVNMNQPMQKDGVMPQTNTVMNQPSPLQDPRFGNNTISPGQLLLSVQKPDGTMIPQANGHYMIVQNLNNTLSNSGKLQSRQQDPGTHPMNRRLDILNPASLANFQPNQANHPNTMAQQDPTKNAFGMQNQNFNLQNAPQGPNPPYFTSNSIHQNNMKPGGQPQMIQSLDGKQLLQNPNAQIYNTNNSSGIAVDSKLGSSASNIPMQISNTGISGQASTANFSGNNPLPYKGVQAAQLPKQPQFNLPGKPVNTIGGAPGQMPTLGIGPGADKS